MGEDATTFDVVVVGAGPGGIAAAVTAAEAGRSVALVDDGPFLGGQIWRNHGEPVPAARRWIDRLGGVTRLSNSIVVARPAPDTLLVETPGGPRVLRWRSLILATGARELFLPFPGWTLPGVMGAGGMQALLKQGLPVAGNRIVVAGSGPLLLAVAELLRRQGAVVPILLEQAEGRRINRFALSLLRSPRKLLQGIALRAKLVGTKYCTGSYPVRVEATDGKLQVHYRKGGREASETCDLLACGFGLIPNTELARLMGCGLTDAGYVKVDAACRTTLNGVFAIGELTGIGGVEKAILEGQLAARDAGGGKARPLIRGRERMLSFARALDEAFALRPEVLRLAEPETVVCRCEDVPLSVIATATSERDAKLQTRCGMGPCQGRICGPIAQRLLGWEPVKVRPPAFPAKIGTLASTDGTSLCGAVVGDARDDRRARRRALDAVPR